MLIDYPGKAHIPSLKRLWLSSFPDPETAVDAFFETAYRRETCRCITAKDGVLAALYWLDVAYKGQTFAYLYAVATDPGHRGKGLCRKLMEDTHGLLKRQGYAGALLLPGEPGLRKLYEKLGYRDQCRIREFSAQAGTPIPLEAIHWREYEALRPALLPEDGARQEGAAYLSTYAKLYRGADFLLAAVQEGDALSGLELLGNVDSASGILATLNCQKGTFRTPGTLKQTVMALPLLPGVDMPGYVGLTFD